MKRQAGHTGPSPSGERFVPQLMGGELIEAEHQARYRLALPFVAGRRVLDAGCGTGWGSELLVQAGASQVVGIDIAQEAVDDARKRLVGARFLRGDLQDLPFQPGSFDVVVCFEALEHTHDAARTLDNLTAVLAGSGLLFVSSPNPDVYPAGNPFHIHELHPDELRDAVAARLDHVALYRQHLHLASTICDDGSGPGAFACVTYPVRPLGPGDEPYSVVIASRSRLPPIPPAQAMSPSEQMQNLDALASALTEERTALAVNHAGIVAERQQLLDELADTRARLSAAGNDLASVMGERDAAETQAIEADGRAARAGAEREDALARAGTAGAQLDAALVRIDDALRRLDSIGRERDRFAVALVLAEQQLATAWDPPDRTEDVDPEESQLQARLTRVIAYAGQLEQELAATHATLSWRVTRPLRRVRARTLRRRRA